MAQLRYLGFDEAIGEVEVAASQLYDTLQGGLADELQQAGCAYIRDVLAEYGIPNRSELTAEIPAHVFVDGYTRSKKSDEHVLSAVAHYFFVTDEDEAAEAINSKIEDEESGWGYQNPSYTDFSLALARLDQAFKQVAEGLFDLALIAADGKIVRYD